MWKKKEIISNTINMYQTINQKRGRFYIYIKKIMFLTVKLYLRPTYVSRYLKHTKN